MPLVTLPSNNTCGLTATGELILGCLGLCNKSSFPQEKEGICKAQVL